jgi:antitoxin ParD1/3/4
LETIGTIAINGCAKGVNVNLPPQLEEMVREKVSPRLCTSASEVVREALRLADEKDRLQAAKLVQLRQDVREGLESGRPPPQAPNKSNAKVGRGALPRGA